MKNANKSFLSPRANCESEYSTENSHYRSRRTISVLVVQDNICKPHICPLKTTGFKQQWLCTGFLSGLPMLDSYITLRGLFLSASKSVHTHIQTVCVCVWCKFLSVCMHTWLTGLIMINEQICNRLNTGNTVKHFVHH